jgi:hypothetical protein
MVVLLENPVTKGESAVAVQVKVAPALLDVNRTFVLALLQIFFQSGLFVRAGNVSTVIVFVMESLHPSVEWDTSFTLYVPVEVKVC